MHSLGAFGAWRKKCQTREKLQRGSDLSSADRLKKEAAEVFSFDRKCSYKVKFDKYLRSCKRCLLTVPTVPSAIVVTAQTAQLISRPASVRPAAEPAALSDIAFVEPSE